MVCLGQEKDILGRCSLLNSVGNVLALPKKGQMEVAERQERKWKIKSGEGWEEGEELEEKEGLD